MGIVAGRNGHGSTLFPKSAVLGTFGFDIYAAYQCGVPVGGRAVLFARMARRPWNHMGMGTWATTTTSPRGAVGDRRPCGARHVKEEEAANASREAGQAVDHGRCELRSREENIGGSCFHRSRREICRLPSSTVVSVPGRHLGAVDWSRERSARL